MWICRNCGERQEAEFDACWNCGASRAGKADPSFQIDESIAAHRRNRRSTIRCLRCDRELDFMGTRYFHEGARMGVLGNLAELFVNQESFDVYSCAECGHVDFFVSGRHRAVDSDPTR
jgi:hypothetical protein